ncbi:MAG: acetamidase/formamidase family protein [Nitrososphaerota archaeon]|nr:acetamidase/formamidase family protein [Candidatus Bathyarchaeota archaeon]MDW8194491.1 acetamidase/formamidase family protein [Nitrososphaerota archaeon]
MKVVSRSKVVYSFSLKNSPVEYVKPGELIMIETEDALGGQIRSENYLLEKIDWSMVNGATGPIFVEGAETGDTLAVDILDVKTADHGVIVVVPKNGVLSSKNFNASVKIVKIRDGFAIFDRVRVKTRPMIGTIGVSPEAGEIPTGSLGRHGGNMDVKKLTAGTRLYLPVFVEGALFAAGDIHALQADGELCVSSVEVAGEVLLRFSLIKNKTPEWPILETHDTFEILACGESLNEAAAIATESAVVALMREHGWSFEEAYMFGSIAVDLEINQAVDPKKGVRAVIPKEYITLNSLIK